MKIMTGITSIVIGLCIAAPALGAEKRDVAQAQPTQQNFTAAVLGEIFAKLRNDNLDLSGVAVIDPQLNLLPQIEANGLMHMAGFFTSVPNQVNFDLLFAPVNGQWRLFGISVSIGQSGPAAPEPPSAPAAQPNGAKQPAAAKNKPTDKPK